MAETKHTPGKWRYSINYGPDDEANYANVYSTSGSFVGNLQTHHAIEIVTACNSHAAMLAALEEAQLIIRGEHLPTSVRLAEIEAAIARAKGEPQ